MHDILKLNLRPNHFEGLGFLIDSIGGLKLKLSSWDVLRVHAEGSKPLFRLGERERRRTMMRILGFCLSTNRLGCSKFGSWESSKKSSPLFSFFSPFSYYSFAKLFVGEKKDLVTSKKGSNFCLEGRKGEGSPLPPKKPFSSSSYQLTAKFGAWDFGKMEISTYS